MTMLEKRGIYATLEYKIKVMRALPIGVDKRSIGEALHAGRSTAVANGRHLDEDDHLFAVSTTTCILFYR